MVYLDEHLPSHPKIFRAGAMLGPNGPAQALSLFVAGLAYARQHLTDGFLPNDFVATCGLVTSPELVANVLASRKVRLWHRRPGGYVIHDFDHWNKKASEIKEKREKDRLRKAAYRAARHGLSHGVSRRDVATCPTGTSRARAYNHNHDHNHVRSTSSNQLEEVAIRVLRTTSKNLPPRVARRNAHSEKRNSRKDTYAHPNAGVIPTALCHRPRQTDLRSHDARRRMARADQVPDHRTRLHVSDCTRCDLSGHVCRRAGTQATGHTTPAATAAGTATAAPRPHASAPGRSALDPRRATSALPLELARRSNRRHPAAQAA